MRPSFKLFLPVILVLLSMNLWGQQAPREILTAEFVSSQSAVLAGETIDVALIVDIHHPWHVYAPVGNDEFTIPVTPSIFDEEKPFGVGEWIYPKADMIAVAGVDEPAAVYGGRIILRTTLAIDPDLTDSIQIEGEVYYQACDDAQCLIPTAINFSYTLPLVEDASLRSATHTELFPKIIPQTEMATDAQVEDDEISGLVDDYGLILTFFIIFFGGLALNLTPCVYPLIPITISFFGGQDTSKGRTFWMALAYVLGIAVTYSVLGVVAALGGGLFGALLTNPIVLLGIAAVLVGLSLSMFGVYEFRLPTGLMTAASQSKAGIFGSFFMGLTLGIVAAPCVGPFVIGLLTYVAAKQSVILGFTMFFTLAMGLGLPYLFLAMYSSKLSSLPRSGTWMIGVRVIFGLVLIAMAIYFIMPLLGGYGNLVMSIFLIGSGVYLIMFDNSAEGNLGFNRIKQGIAILLVIIGTWTGIPEPERVGEGITWEHPTSQVELDALLMSDAPIMIDVYADWCIPCKEMDKFTFPDAEVVKLSKKFTAIKIDMTKDTGDFEKYFQKKYSIKGVPSYIFIDNGLELTSLRSTGFEKAEDFLKRMQGAL
ncbi:MAG: thioredoxin family protein [Candidatus Marinimicrobia bacterium]|nr:thioredoxin family protein [FCB group bacterium]MBL7025302.1 thioredoxin family protein [Candidatus Neomarinimicrobiota bacterium]